MRIGIITPRSVPDVVGGAERLYDGLVTALRESTPHDVELVRVPSPEHSFRQLVESYEAFRTLDVSRFDLVISTKYPSWMVRHPQHVVYMLHPLRGLYDAYHYFGLPTEVTAAEPEARALLHVLRTTPHGTDGGAERVLGTAAWTVDRLGDDHPACAFPGPLVRALVHWLDRDALHPRRIRAYRAISRRVTERHDYFPPGVTVLPVPPPSSLEGLSPGPFTAFFTASRLDSPKRIDLLIEAMAHVDREVELRIAGTGPDEERLRKLRPDDPRITFLGRISEEQLRQEYQNALAVPFVPLDEDFGLVTVEAQRAAKPVVTCVDSGGVVELVEDGRSGFVVEPDPVAIAGALNRLAEDPSLAERMGREGAESVRDITWTRVVDALLPPFEPVRASRPERPRRRPERRLVVLSTYPASPARGGGQLRLNRLVRGLAERFDVDVITLDDAGGEPGVTELGPRCRQTVIAKSDEHLALEGGLGSRSPIPVGDLAASLFVDRTPEYIDAVRSAARTAMGAVLAHPYLLPALRRAAPDLPFVYDAHNAETAMKRELLADAAHRDALLAVVQTVERHAVQEAELVVTCSTEDRQRLEQMAPTLADWALAPNGADVLDTEFVTGDARRARRDDYLKQLNAIRGTSYERLALFVASYHPPNIEAAQSIIALAPALPQFAFVLAGSHGDHFRDWRLPSNVVLAGVVPQHTLRILLGAADVALNPITSGGGTNLKLIEYFAAGAPVVSTELGVRGIEARDGEHCLLAASTDHFVDAIHTTIASPSDTVRRATRARQLAERRYDWHTIAVHYATTIEEALQSVWRAEGELPVD